MKPQRFDGQFAAIFDLAVSLAGSATADALLVLLESPMEWDELMGRTRGRKLVVAADREEELAGASEAGIDTVLLNMPLAPVFEKLTHALLTAVSRELLSPDALVAAVYSGFEQGEVDSLSLVRLEEHLGRLTSRDLQQLSTNVPLETLKVVVDLAVDIGREGREGKPVGTLFIVGDHRKVLAHSYPAGFDPVRGYGRKERSLHDIRVREGIKEIAQLDGAFLITSDGTVEAACRLVEVGTANVTLSKGLGARHLAAAAITKNTKAVAVAVSESSGTVRVFQGGEVLLRIEPFRRAMKWKDFEFDTPQTENA